MTTMKNSKNILIKTGSVDQFFDNLKSTMRAVDQDRMGQVSNLEK